MKSSLMAWVTAGFASLFCMSCSPTKIEYLTVGANNWIGYTPLFLAQESGLYQPHHIRIAEMPSASMAIKAIVDETLDVAALTLDEALTLLEAQYELEVILVIDVSNGADALLAKPGIETLEQLKGKKIVVEATAVGALMLQGVLSAASLTADDVTIVRCAVDQHEYCFKNADAVVTFEPLKGKLIKQGAVELFNSSQIPNHILDVLVVRKDVAERQGAQLKALLEGYFIARDRLVLLDNKALELTADALKIDTQRLSEAFQGLKLLSLTENYTLLSGKPPELVKIATHLQRVMKGANLLQREVPLERIADGKFLPEVAAWQK